MTRALLLLVLLAGCRSSSDGGEGDSKLQPITAEEVSRGETACRDLAERTCRCAAGKPELAAACDEAKALPEALRMGVQAAESDGLEEKVRARLQYDVRQTMGRCFERMNGLLAQGCR